jgi:hypothetical protein
MKMKTAEIIKCRDGRCSEASKYKCPVCCIRYCSLACFKLHKSGECLPLIPDNLPLPEKEVAEECKEQKLSKGSLKELFTKDDRLKKLLADPIFVKAIKEVASIPIHERKAKILYLLEVYPDFTYFADCLKPVESQGEGMAKEE